MNEPSPQTIDYRFLDWHYTPERRVLSGPSGKFRLKPLSDRLLRRLLDAPGSVLSREHLISQVWTRREVNDEVLSRAIAELRALLGDDAREPRFIETLSKGGYRWIAPIANVGPPANDVASAPAPPVTSSGEARRRFNPTMIIGALSLLIIAIWMQWPRSTDSRIEHAVLTGDLLGARPIAADSRLEIDARFDAIGRVAYVRTDAQGATNELILVDPATMAERVLWQDPLALRRPTPSPSGHEIAVMRRGDQSCELWSVAVIDLHRTRLGDCAVAAAGGMEWVDGGDALIYTGAAADAKHSPGLMLVDRRTGAQRVLTAPDVDEGAHVDPRLSSDAAHLVYASKHGAEGQLWRTDWPRQRERSALLKRPEPIFGHAFDGRSGDLWIAGDLTLYRALYRLHGSDTPELIGGRGAISIDLAATGAAIWSEANYDADIWIREHANAPWATIAGSNRYESQPEFSADGQRVALVSNRNGTENVLVFDGTDGSVRHLPLDKRLRWVRPTWSARDQSLIITAYEDRHTRLYRYRLDGDVARVLPHVEQDAFHGIELTDRLLYLSGHGTEQSKLMQLRHGHTKPENLGLGTVSTFRASQDWLVWRAPGAPSLHAAPLPALAPIRVVKAVDENLPEAFTVTGNALYFVDKGALLTVNLPDGEPVPVVTDKLPNGSGPNLAVSGTGALAVVTQTSLSIDLMIAEPSRGRALRAHEKASGQR